MNEMNLIRSGGEGDQMDWKFSPSDMTSFNLHLYKCQGPSGAEELEKMGSNGSSKSVSCIFYSIVGGYGSMDIF